MESDNAQLIEKYHNGSLSTQEEMLLEKRVASGEIDMAVLSLDTIQHKLNAITTPEPSRELSENFYTHLNSEMRKSAKLASGTRWLADLWSNNLAWRMAYSIGLLMVGLTVGYFLSNSSDGDKLELLSSEVSDMKEMMMLTLLEKESPSERLRAVSLTNDMPEVSKKVTEALLKTLNTDGNVNVRLAALEALSPYVAQPEVRRGLIRSISLQKSPLVQMALAEMMVALQEKGSVENLQKVMRNDSTPPEVKDRIEKSIQVLI